MLDMIAAVLTVLTVISMIAMAISMPVATVFVAIAFAFIFLVVGKLTDGKNKRRE